MVHFNPHLPRGRRRQNKAYNDFCEQFQPTPPSREATTMAISNIAIVVISTHTSLAGGDIQSVPFRCPGGAFQPTPPSREATTKVQQDYAASLISTHTSLAGCDAESVHLRRSAVNFNPHLPRGRRLWYRTKVDGSSGFQPTPPSREATISRTINFWDA